MDDEKKTLDEMSKIFKMRKEELESVRDCPQKRVELKRLDLRWKHVKKMFDKEQRRLEAEVKEEKVKGNAFLDKMRTKH